jgi:hypothetical protein
MLELANALPDRHPGTEREHEERDDERPEIEFAPVAELMMVIGKRVRALKPIEKQQLVDAVDEAMHRFREHRGRTGYPGGNGLRCCNQDVPGKRRVDRIG